VEAYQASTSRTTQRRYSACESHSECGIETARRTRVPLGALSSFRIALPAEVALSPFKVIEYRRSSFRSEESTDLSRNPWVNRFSGAKIDRQCSFVESRTESLFFQDDPRPRPRNEREPVLAEAESREAGGASQKDVGAWLGTTLAAVGSDLVECRIVMNR